MEPVVLMLGTFIGFGLGYMLGRFNGYLDARPRRDDKGRFIKRK